MTPALYPQLWAAIVTFYDGLPAFPFPVTPSVTLESLAGRWEHLNLRGFSVRLEGPASNIDARLIASPYAEDGTVRLQCAVSWGSPGGLSPEHGAQAIALHQYVLDFAKAHDGVVLGPE